MTSLCLWSGREEYWIVCACTCVCVYAGIHASVCVCAGVHACVWTCLPGAPSLQFQMCVCVLPWVCGMEENMCLLYQRAWMAQLVAFSPPRPQVMGSWGQGLPWVLTSQIWVVDWYGGYWHERLSNAHYKWSFELVLWTMNEVCSIDDTDMFRDLISARDKLYEKKRGKYWFSLMLL